jgi:hypothetical protein
MLFYEIITIYAAKVGCTYSSYWELKGYYHHHHYAWLLIRFQF